MDVKIPNANKMIASYRRATQDHSFSTVTFPRLEFKAGTRLTRLTPVGQDKDIPAGEQSQAAGFQAASCFFLFFTGYFV
jgi:hypothetical protein